MKQLTPEQGFRLTFGRDSVRQRVRRALLPALTLPIDLDLFELMQDLDPGMVDPRRRAGFDSSLGVAGDIAVA